MSSKIFTVVKKRNSDNGIIERVASFDCESWAEVIKDRKNDTRTSVSAERYEVVFSDVYESVEEFDKEVLHPSLLKSIQAKLTREERTYLNLPDAK